MPTKQLMIECEGCGAPTLHIQQNPNHILHLLLSIVTFGLWILIWIFQCSSPATCTVCGHQKKANISLGVVLALILLVLILIGVIIE